MRILLLAPRFGYNLSKAWTSNHFCHEIESVADVIWVDTLAVPRTGIDRNAAWLAEYHRADMVIVWRLQFAKHYEDIDKVTVPTVCFVEDYFPRHYEVKNEWLTRHGFNLVFFSQNYFLDEARAAQSRGELPSSTRFSWLPFAVDANIYSGRPKADRPWDVTFLALDHQDPATYPNRRAVHGELKRLVQERVGSVVFNQLIPNPAGRVDPGGGVYGYEYVELLKSSKILVCSLDRYGSCNYRHFEGMACGCCVLTDGPPKDADKLGFSSENLALYNLPGDLNRTITGLLGSEGARLELAQSGRSLILERHSTTKRVAQMFAEIKGL